MGSSLWQRPPPFEIYSLQCALDTGLPNIQTMLCPSLLDTTAPLLLTPANSIVLNNRDEFLARPTLPAAVHHFGKTCHHEGDNIISGLDIKAGGTWLGINRHGRIAML